MNTYQLWLLLREHVDVRQYNDLFNQEIESLLPNLKDPFRRQQLEDLLAFDWVGYLSAALRRAGYRGDDVEERVHALVIRMLVVPGTLFGGYDQEKHSPITARFKTAVTNAIENLVAKERRRRDQMLSATVPMAFLSMPEQEQKVIEDFRQFVRQRLGPLGLTILDARLDGDHLKPFVNAPDLGRPSTYLVKMTVKRLKQLAVEFGKGTGDPDFGERIEAAAQAAQRRTGP